MEAGAPKDFVGHPVADARETFLHEEHGFDRRACASTQEDLDDADGEFLRENRGRDLLPPRRHAFSLPELDATELTRVDEDEFLSAGHRQLEVVVRRRLAIGVAGFEPTGHPEMHAEPGAAGEPEGHLLSRGDGLDEFRPDHGLGHRFRILAAPDTGLGIQVELRDLPPDTWIPAAAEIFDFGEFGHRRS